mgnify:CR=1 FL=1
MGLRSLPISRDTDAAVDENGVAYPFPGEDAAPFIAPTQVKVWVGGLSFVGWGEDTSPPAAAVGNSVYQEANTEEVYDICFPADTLIDHLYVYAESTSVTHAVRVSFFG